MNAYGKSVVIKCVEVWEMQIKLQIGKLKLSLPLATLVTAFQQNNQLQILSVTLDHVFALDNLPLHHKDPFDRILIGQANSENASLVSSDGIFTNYPVNLVW